MQPNDQNGQLPPRERPFRVLILSASQRRQYNCPGVDSKSRTLMLRMAELLPSEWEIDMEDLGNVFGRERIQPCNACVSTSMALCCWPCLPASERVMGRDLQSIAQLEAGDAVSTGRVARAWMSSPRAAVFCLKISDGRQVRLTANHPVKVLREVRREKVEGQWKGVWKEEWVEAAKLRSGDKIPFPLGEQCGAFHADSGYDSFYYLLAGLVFGDGTFAGTGQVRLFFDSRKPALLEAVRALSPVKCDIRRQVYSAKENGWPRTADSFMSYGCWDVSVGKILMSAIGLDKTPPAAQRHLPPSVLNGSRREVCAFLRGWFSADGSIDYHDTKTRVSLCSVSVRHCAKRKCCWPSWAFVQVFTTCPGAPPQWAVRNIPEPARCISPKPSRCGFSRSRSVFWAKKPNLWHSNFNTSGQRRSDSVAAAPTATMAASSAWSRTGKKPFTTSPLMAATSSSRSWCRFTIATVTPRTTTTSRI